MVKNEPERDSKKCFKKGYTPTTQKAPYLQAGRLLETTPRVRIFNNRNNSSWTATAATAATIAKTAARVQFMFEVVA